MALTKMAERCYAECHLCWLSLMLSVTFKPFMMCVVIPNVIMLSVVAPSVVFINLYTVKMKIN